MSWANLNIDVSRITTHGKTLCPKCSAERKKSNDPCLSVDIINGLYNCHHCGWKGSIKSRDYTLPDDKGHDLTEKSIKYFESRKISKATLDKMQITEGLTYMPDGERNAIRFNYFRNGICINIKYRDGKKQFKMFKGAELIFYNLDSIKNTDEVIITEGEFDCLSFIEAGLDFCVSVPNGANNINYIANCFEYFKDKKRIYICVDKDEAGKKLEQELIRRFGRDKCFIIDLPCKDANELLMKTDKDELLWAYRNAEQTPLDDIHYVSSVKSTMLYQFDHGRERGTTTYLNKLDEHFTWKKGQVSLFHGIGNRGKSTFLYYLCLLKSMNEGTKWGIFSPEHYPSNEFFDNLVHSYVGKNIDKRFDYNRCTRQEYEAGLEFIGKHFFYVCSEMQSPTPAYINSKFQELIIRHGIEGAVIDPYNQLDNDMAKFGRDDLYISDFLSKEKKFALQHDIYKIIVAHPKTMGKNGKLGYECPDVYDLYGGSMWNNKCDNIIAVHAPNWADDKTDTLRLINIQKIKTQALVGIPGEIHLNFDRVSNRYIELMPTF